MQENVKIFLSSSASYSSHELISTAELSTDLVMVMVMMMECVCVCVCVCVYLCWGGVLKYSIDQRAQNTECKGNKSVNLSKLLYCH